MPQPDTFDRYCVQGAADAQTLPRILNFFAQRGVLPTKVIATAQGSTLQVMVEVPVMGGSRELIAEKIRQLVLVDEVKCFTQPVET